MVFSVEEVLMDIYDGNPTKVDTETATKAFFEWLQHHNAHYFATSNIPIEEIVLMAVLEAIKKGKQIVVVATLPTLGDDKD